MNINGIGGQNPVQLYQNNQSGATHDRQENTKEATAANTESARVDISQRARTLQAKRDFEATERVADNEQTEKSRQTTRQENETTRVQAQLQSQNQAQTQAQAVPANRRTIDVIA